MFPSLLDLYHIAILNEMVYCFPQFNGETANSVAVGCKVKCNINCKCCDYSTIFFYSFF